MYGWIELESLGHMKLLLFMLNPLSDRVKVSWMHEVATIYGIE